MSNRIRISPSGPFVTNDDGGIFDPGPGARIRLAQGHCTVATVTQIPTTTPAVIGPVLNTTPLVVSLSNPKPNCQYRATIVCDVSSEMTVRGDVTLYLDTSIDNAAWIEAASNVHYVAGGGAANGSNGARQIRLDLTLTPGADLDVTSAPAPAALYVRARILGNNDGTAVCRLQSAATDAAGVGTILLELEETL